MRVRISQAMNSDSMLSIPGMARRSMGVQFWKMEGERGCQQEGRLRVLILVLMKRRMGRRFCVMATAMGAPVKPQLSFYELLTLLREELLLEERVGIEGDNIPRQKTNSLPR